MECDGILLFGIFAICPGSEAFAVGRWKRLLSALISTSLVVEWSEFDMDWDVRVM